MADKVMRKGLKKGPSKVVASGNPGWTPQPATNKKIARKELGRTAGIKG
jgi:hypothetical protein